jgi:oxygen-independent coproporphyrinogen-3 oxidase
MQMTVPIPLISKGINPAALPAAPVAGLYVHIPFCFHKCHYCDFYSITHQNHQRMASFVDRVLTEAELWAQRPGERFRPQTAFFGGGTPSLLPSEQMSRLIDGLRRRIDMSVVNEFTVEVNPATASLDYLFMLNEMGVDRLSLGAQSFERTDLAMLERHHDPDDLPQSIALALQARFERLSIDLIYAIPGQTLESWQHTLEQAVLLRLSHYSCYGLTYEPNTPMAVRKRLGQVQAADEQLELAMMRHARKRLAEVGCPAYEISNYARAGQVCRHNLMYWTGGNYIGLGPSAASHVEGCRFKNRPHLGEWERSIDSGVLPASEVEHLSPGQRADELVMLMLRLERGIRFTDFADRTGLDARRRYDDQLSRLSRAGLLRVDNSGFGLSKSGLAVADAVAAEFLGIVE